MRPRAHSDLDRQGECVGLRLALFANPPFRIRASGVGVAHHGASKARMAIVVGQPLLDHQLAALLGIQRRLRVRFGYRERDGVAKSRVGRGKDESPTPALRDGSISVIAPATFFRRSFPDF